MVDRRRCDVVGVAEPRLVTAFGTIADPRHGAEARHRDRSRLRPVSKIMAVDTSDRVVASDDQQHRLGQGVAVEDCPALEHGLGVFGNEVAPLVERPGARFGDENAAAWGLVVGVGVDEAVASEVQGWSARQRPLAR